MPRPSKRFWVTAICYTCFVIFLKYVFSFNFYPWTADGRPAGRSADNVPFYLPRIIGIEKKPHLKYLDIGQLLVLFFQRGLLKVKLVAKFTKNHFLQFRFMGCGKIMMNILIRWTIWFQWRILSKSLAEKQSIQVG